MTLAICFACGAMKFGAFCPCDKCEALPRSEEEIAISLAFSDHHFPISTLEQISEAVLSGKMCPKLTPETLEALRPAARDAQRMLGITPKNV